MDKNLEYDYSLLEGKIKEKFGTQYKFALALGTSGATLSAKLNCRTDFTQSEIDTILKLLSLDKALIPQYFFTLKVKLA